MATTPIFTASMRWLTFAIGFLFGLLALLWLAAILYGLHLPTGIELVITTGLMVYGMVLAASVLRRWAKVKAQGAPKTSRFLLSSPGVSEMNDHFQKAFSALKSTHPSALTRLPWYLVIGRPGSGKTTMLQESGLEFASFGAGSSCARGPTRTCDWWLTKEAVLLDTAGRYLADNTSHSEWTALLELVRQARPALALNGIVMTVSIPDLIKMDEASVSAQAQRAHERLAELHRLFALEIPLYVVFSKCDTIDGFNEVVALLPLSERDQPWGTILPWPSEAVTDVRGMLKREVEALLTSLRARCSEERADDQQEKPVRFSHEFAVASKWVGDLLTALLHPRPGQMQPRLRGFFFASGQQALSGDHTSPAECISQSLAQATERGMKEISGLVQASTTQVASASPRHQGVFLKDLLITKILGDYGLACISPLVRLRRQMVQGAALIIGTGLLLMLVWFVT